MEMPFQKIKKYLSKELPSELIENLPNKWEKVGKVGIIKLPKDLKEYHEIIGKTYAKILNCNSILNDTGGISGEFRQPNFKLIFGTSDTEVIHKENGIKFKFDPQKIMFSSGNMDERIRMANISNKNETVVDLFAGIGYFSLPIAVYSRPKKVFACEKNSIAFDYLNQNISLNKVNDNVETIKGDNRKIAPKNISDRVLMGYFGNTISFLPTAIECLKNKCGIIHYHDKFPDKNVPKNAIENVIKLANRYERKVELLDFKHVKTYAPGISHYVFDLKIGE